MGVCICQHSSDVGLIKEGIPAADTPIVIEVAWLLSLTNLASTCTFNILVYSNA